MYTSSFISTCLSELPIRRQGIASSSRSEVLLSSSFFIFIMRLVYHGEWDIRSLTLKLFCKKFFTNCLKMKLVFGQPSKPAIGCTNKPKFFSIGHSQTARTLKNKTVCAMFTNTVHGAPRCFGVWANKDSLTFHLHAYNITPKVLKVKGKSEESYSQR